MNIQIIKKIYATQKSFETDEDFDSVLSQSLRSLDRINQWQKS